jgi:WD40 repeat protein
VLSRRSVGVGTDVVELWDVATGVWLRTFSGHTDSVSCAAFSQDGTKVLTASTANTAVLWDVATGALIKIFADNDSSVNSVALSGDGSAILMACGNGRATRWDAVSCTPARIFLTRAVSTQTFSERRWNGQAVEPGQCRSNPNVLCRW